VLVGHSFGGIGSIEASLNSSFAKKVKAVIALDPGILPKGRQMQEDSYYLHKHSPATLISYST
jgi:hypothetical protein